MKITVFGKTSYLPSSYKNPKICYGTKNGEIEAQVRCTDILTGKISWLCLGGTVK
jgi:outer membrane protein assembly factor BamB